MALYILTHRQVPNWKTKFYTPLHMSMLDNPDVKLQVKDYYPEMAKLNHAYNELSGMYYIWQNDHDNIKGNVQYRVTPKLTENEIFDILKTYKFIGYRCIFDDITANRGLVLSEQFKKWHDTTGEIWESVLYYIRESGIKEYIIDTWQNLHYMFARNILITTQNYYNEYCDWMFPIIYKIQDKFNLHTMPEIFEWAKIKRPEFPEYHARILGCLAERLQTLFILNNINLTDIEKEVYCPNFTITTQVPFTNQ